MAFCERLLALVVGGEAFMSLVGALWSQILCRVLAGVRLAGSVIVIGWWCLACGGGWDASIGGAVSFVSNM